MLLFFIDWPHCQTDDQIAPRASFADGRSVRLLPHSFSWQNFVQFIIDLEICLINVLMQFQVMLSIMKEYPLIEYWAL